VQTCLGRLVHQHFNSRCGRPRQYASSGLVASITTTSIRSFAVAALGRCAPNSLEYFREFKPTALQLGDAVVQLAQFLCEPGDSDVVGLVVLRELPMLGCNLVG
jgi:hypothetical protein